MGLSDAITIEYWFKGSNIQSAVRFQTPDNQWIIAGWGSGTFKHILSNDGGTNGIDVGAAATDGNWHHVAMTWQRNTTNGFKSYLDGQLVAQRNSSNNSLPQFTGNMWLGALKLNTPTEFMNGSLDEVRVWNVARTQAEIQANRMGCTALGATPNLIVYYQFNHGTADGSNSSITTMANSVNSNAFSAVLNNFARSGSSSNWVASPLCTDIYTWTGAASTDWANQANWSPTVVPTNTSSIVIPPTTNGLMLAANRTINQLTFTGATKIKLDGFNLTVNGLNGGGSNAYVVTSGTLGSNPTLTIKNVGTTPTLFPVGTSETVYAPVTITNNATARDFTVKVGTTISNPNGLNNIVNLQWDITPSVSTGNSATLALGWSAAQQSASFNPNSSVQIAHNNGTTWDNFRMATVTGSNPYTATATGITAFSPFVITNSMALPVELLTFKGRYIPPFGGQGAGG